MRRNELSAQHTGVQVAQDLLSVPTEKMNMSLRKDVSNKRKKGWLVV